MTATNHAMAGALLGAFLPLPIAIPLAFLSHFALDMLPHYGIPHDHRNHSLRFKLIIFGDVTVALSMAAFVAYFRKWNMEITGWVAFSPDATWVLHYYKQGKNLAVHPKNRFMDWHKAIQHYERPWGIWVELVAFLIMFPVFVQQVVA